MIRLFLAGDVMLGRAIDQILQHPGDPTLFEDFLHSAEDYVHLAERTSGPIPRGVDLDYVWGDAGAALDRANVDYGIVNLETAITDAGTPEPKGINYRMNPTNAAGLKRLGIDCCVLANNHVLDWGKEGLNQTIDTLRKLAMATSGAGRNAVKSGAPAVLGGSHGRVLVFAFAAMDSGVPRNWSAQPDRPGVNFIEAFDDQKIQSVKAEVLAARKSGDIVIASIHWGGNWGHHIPAAHVSFAHALIDEAMVDIIHGHSSHHPKGWEIYRGKLILYGCGDFLNDYEGIAGHEEYRGDLALMYLPMIDEAGGGSLASLDMVPFQIRRFRLNRATQEDARWLCTMLNLRCRSSGTWMTVGRNGILHLKQEYSR
jgi:poly-gamma-glutamate capsule biosynthesis protein CapA/YwtB (metallophosphatase superfamily)